MASNYEFKFEENKGAYTKEMLDEVPKGWGMTLRAYLEYGREGGYIDVEDIDSMTDEEICESVDFIDYLETK